ncbi:hypothetical protein SpCBS45565_g07896 [Spizellomyces sp. 'palustris']|nr:hypothetical protein SpCBS45565_g07896 [Spizellomyces sp. 'palustris']
MSTAPVLNDYVFGITCVVIAVCVENQGRIMTTFKRWNTPLFYSLTLQNAATFFHAWMFLRVWNFGYVEDIAFNFFDGLAYILMVNLSGWIHYDHTGLFQALYKGKISSDVTSISGPVTAFYYIVLELILGSRLIYNLIKATWNRDVSSFIFECKMSVVFFLCTDVIYVITMFTSSPGMFVSIKTLCYALKLKYTLLMYDDVKTQIIQGNSQKSGSNHGKASVNAGTASANPPTATNVLNTSSMC